jgi:hypothetical protein
MKAFTTLGKRLLANGEQTYALQRIFQARKGAIQSVTNLEEAQTIMNDALST